MSERGPFRTAEPTPDARLAKENEASWERVHDITSREIARDRSRARRHRAIAWALFITAVIGTAALVITALFEATAAPFLCLAIAASLVSGVIVFRLKDAGPPAG